MVNFNLQLPENLAAEFHDAAAKLAARFPGASPQLDAKSLMVFALASVECDDLCEQFDLALRLIQGGHEPPFNPVLDEDFDLNPSSVPKQPAHSKAVA
jgi:hypothetical protein